MKAAVVPALGSPLEIRDVEATPPGAHEVVVRIEASGLCHTDIHAARGEWPVTPTAPFIPGHEGVGIVTEAGELVDGMQVGRRVAVPWLGQACGRCEFCTSGWETLCMEQVNTGYGRDGCFAQYVTADGRYVVPVPDGVDPLDAAPLTCAGVTTYKAVKVAGVRPATRVAVFGVGGLGHLAVQYAAIAGGEVIVVDITESKLTMAKDLGATHVVNASQTSPADAIHDLGGADAVISTAASPQAIEAALGSLRRNGTLVIVGLPADNTIEVPVFQTVLGGNRIIGSIVGTRQDLAEVFMLHAAGRTKVVRIERELDEVNHCIDDVLAGRIDARVVFDLRA